MAGWTSLAVEVDVSNSSRPGSTDAGSLFGGGDNTTIITTNDLTRVAYALNERQVLFA